LKDFLRK